jgi:hypothetical protein
MEITIDILHGYGYRIGCSDRNIGDATANPDGFIVYNQTNGNCFIAQAGVWIDGGEFPNTYLQQWYES